MTKLRAEVRKAEKLLKAALDRAGIKRSKEADLPRGLSVTRIMTDQYAKSIQELSMPGAPPLRKVIEANAIADFIEYCEEHKIKHVMNPNVWVGVTGRQWGSTWKVIRYLNDAANNK